MNPTHTNLQSGEQYDFVGEFITARSFEFRGDRVRRLLVVDDDGTELQILVSPECELVAGLKVGDSYRFKNLLWVSLDTEVSVDGTSKQDLGFAVREAALQLDIDNSVGLVDERTSIENV